MLFLVLSGSGYFWYQSRRAEFIEQQRKVEAERQARENTFSNFFKNLENNITVLPSAGDGATGTARTGEGSGLPISPKVKLPGSATSSFQVKAGLKASRAFIDFYTTTAGSLQKIAGNLQSVQQTLNEISRKYSQGESYFSFAPLTEHGKEQNKTLAAEIEKLKNNLSGWAGENQKTANSVLQAASGKVIDSGNRYALALADFSRALDAVLSYKGIGDISKLSQDLQAAGNRANESAKEVSSSFQALNSVLSSL